MGFPIDIFLIELKSYANLLPKSNNLYSLNYFDEDTNIHFHAQNDADAILQLYLYKYIIFDKEWLDISYREYLTEDQTYEETYKYLDNEFIIDFVENMFDNDTEWITKCEVVF